MFVRISYNEAAMLELEPFKRADFGWLIARIDTPEFLMQWGGTNMDFPLDEAQLEKIFAKSLGDEPALLPFKAVDTATGETIGYIELLKIDRRNRSATVGRVLVGDPGLRGRGLGAQMVERALEYGFERLGLHRIELLVFDFNEQAVACYEKAGFRKEGLLRHARRFRDRYLNLVQMAVLEEDWKDRKLKY